MFQRNQNTGNQETTFKLVKLKNGSEVGEGLIDFTLQYLNMLMNFNRVDFQEFVKKCKNPNYVSTDNSLGMYQSTLAGCGSWFPVLRDILVSAIEGEGENMRLGNPVASEPAVTNRM